MSERSWMEPIVERVVSQSLESHASQLRSEIVRRVIEEVEGQAPPAAAQSSSGSASADLARAVAEIQTGSSQKEILRALLDHCGRYAARTALFVVKGSHASGWQGRGFSNLEALKEFALDASASAVSCAINDRVVVSAPAADFDGRFLQQFGTPSSGDVKLLPLLLKDKVAALVYVDAGTDGTGQLDSGAIELIVLATSAWLEVNALRKQVHKEPIEAPAPAPMAAAAPASPAFNDPFAAHAPSHAMAAAASADSSTSAAAAAIAEPPTVAEPIAVEPPHDAEPAAAEVPAASSEDQDTHRKAQRFARLLVDEIKLYNQAKVAEGRKHKDLYNRLKETIEKSRATYQKRYGNTVASSGNYFQHELVRSLAEDDISIMGTNFKH